MKLRPTGGRIRGFAPILLTGAAAALGYAFAVYPIWRQAHAARDMTTNLRSAALDAYTESVGGAGFDKITWVVPTVMTPFVKMCGSIDFEKSNAGKTSA